MPCQEVAHRLFAIRFNHHRDVPCRAVPRSGGSVPCQIFPCRALMIPCRAKYFRAVPCLAVPGSWYQILVPGSWYQILVPRLNPGMPKGPAPPGHAGRAKPWNAEGPFPCAGHAGHLWLRSQGPRGGALKLRSRGYQDPGTKILVPTIFREKVKPITTPPDKVFKLSG